MRIHILGICGTFMGGLALLGRELGHEISGSDANVYPPMSEQLAQAGIQLSEGYLVEHLSPKPDITIIGNTLSRGNPCIEYILDEGLAFTSGPHWLSEHLLKEKTVLAVSGTHGKTSTTSMLAWLLEVAGKSPGFLIGGIAENFSISARSGESEFFVIEADEFDTAFFDKRSKFIHYNPQTLVINNIEYDHADIFPDINAIRREFHHLIRILPRRGKIIYRQNDTEIDKLLAMGVWTPMESFGLETGEWTALPLTTDYADFEVLKRGKRLGRVQWDLIGRHNAENALAAIAAANSITVDPVGACEALSQFKSVKRRLQKLACVNDITIYDDFAHHPTAIQTTLQALRANLGKQRIISILEPRSNSMKMGVHKDTLASALNESDMVMLYQSPDVQWDLSLVCDDLGEKCKVYKETKAIIDDIMSFRQAGDHVLVMSNGGFENIQQRLISKLQDE